MVERQKYYCLLRRNGEFGELDQSNWGWMGLKTTSGGFVSFEG
jgi:hypothetical protein